MFRSGPIKDCPLLFLDLETSGLSPTKNEILDIACVLTDPTGRTVLDTYSALVSPTRPVDPEAARINGYTMEKWASAIPLNQSMVKLLTMAHGAIHVGHNQAFDSGFIQTALAECHQKWTGRYYKIDTMPYAMPLLKAGLVENIKLTTLTAYFGIPHDDAHRALSDALACRLVYLKLMDIYGPAIQAYAESRKAADAAGLDTPG